MRAELDKKVPRPPSSRRARYERVLTDMRRQSPQERFQALVEAGILTKNGKLEQRYRPSDEEQTER